MRCRGWWRGGCAPCSGWDRRTAPRGWAGRAARGVDGELSGLPKLADPRPVLPPLGQPFLPEGSLLGRVLLRGDPLPLRLLLVDPGEEIALLQVGEGQEEVGQVSLRVDHDGGDVVDHRLLQEPDAESRLPPPRHPHADRVRDKVPGIVEDQVLLERIFFQVEFAAEVEHPEFFEILHGSPPARYSEKNIPQAAPGMEMPISGRTVSSRRGRTRLRCPAGTGRSARDGSRSPG